MTYPGFPFPPGTPLFSSHEYVEEYHRDFALHCNLMPYIMLNHTVLSASWVGSSEQGRWDLVVADHNGQETRRSFDHLVVANGHNHYPHSPTFPGQDEWLRHGGSGRQREILHSIFYREPERYANQTVVVVGSGASGRDAASQVVLYARKVAISVDANVTLFERRLGLSFCAQFARSSVRSGQRQARDRVLYARCHRLRRRFASIRRRRRDTGDRI